MSPLSAYYKLIKQLSDKDTTTKFPSIMTDNNTTTFTLTYDNIVPKTVVTVIVHPTVTVIEDRAFSHCTSLTSIIIPDLVTTIGQYAFSGCTSLTSIIIPDLVTTIGYGAFCGCTSLV
jgi:hypothetical protein